MMNDNDEKLKIDIIKVFKERIEDVKLLKKIQAEIPNERDVRKIALMIRKLNPSIPTKKGHELAVFYADMNYDVSGLPHNPNRLFDGQRPVVYQWFKYRNLSQFGWKQLRTIAAKLHIRLSDLFLKAGY